MPQKDKSVSTREEDKFAVHDFQQHRKQKRNSLSPLFSNTK